MKVETPLPCFHGKKAFTLTAARMLAAEKLDDVKFVFVGSGPGGASMRRRLLPRSGRFVAIPRRLSRKWDGGPARFSGRDTRQNRFIRNSPLSWEEKFEFDVWYVENRWLWLDIKILWLTVLSVFQRKDINAPGSATAPEFAGSPKPLDLQS